MLGLNRSKWQEEVAVKGELPGGHFLAFLLPTMRYRDHSGLLVPRGTLWHETEWGWAIEGVAICVPFFVEENSQVCLIEWLGRVVEEVGGLVDTPLILIE